MFTCINFDKIDKVDKNDKKLQLANVKWEECNEIWSASCRRLARSSLLYKVIEKYVRVATLYESEIS